MASKAEERSGMVQVDLSDDQVAQRSAKMASEELARETLLEKKRTHNRKWNEELKQVGTSISVLAAEVDTHQAWVPAQSDMFGTGGEDGEDGEAPPKRRRGRRAAAANDAAEA